jgi:hypothetical protein
VTKNDISEKYKIPLGVLSRIESIGRGQLHQELLYRYEKQYRIIGKMPIDEQEKILNRGVEVLTTSGVLRVAIDDLQIGQVEQVFAGMMVRSVAAQKSWIEDRKVTEEIAIARRVNPKADCGYRVKNDSLIVTTLRTFTRKELLEILAKM